MNRCINILEQLDRESEHKRRCDRVTRSREVYNAALSEAIDAGIILTCNGTRYELSDNRHVVRFYDATNTLSRQKYGEAFPLWIDLEAENDIHGIVLMFLEGKFLK